MDSMTAADLSKVYSSGSVHRNNFGEALWPGPGVLLF